MRQITIIAACLTLVITAFFNQSIAEDMKYPSGWNKTIEDLIKENRELSSKEIEYARNYEKAMLPDNIRFPKDNEIYESTEDVEITYITHWSMPFTGGEKFILKKGAEIKVSYVDDSDPKPLGVYAKPLKYENYEEMIIPEEDRSHPKYGGYSLRIDTKTLHEKFKLKNSDNLLSD